MTWILLACGSVLFFTSLNLLQRIVAVESKNPRAMAVVFNFIAAVIALLIFFTMGSFRDFTLSTSPKAWLALVVASFCYAMFERGRFVASKLLDASVLTTVMNISVLVAFISAIFLYSEPLTSHKLLGGILIITALVIVSLNNNKTKTKKSSAKGVAIAVLISIMLGLGWALDKLGAQSFNAETYSIFIWTVPVIFIYFPRVKFSAIKSELKIASWRVFALAGLNVVGYLLQLKALETAEATRVIPIVQTSTLFTVLMGILFLKERQHILRKIIAGVTAIAGVYFLI
ncbi:DMT family transporter [Patescibacteria group bacterium]|nr:DMT family transporter [Patescibacteria group bacterium]